MSFGSFFLQNVDFLMCRQNALHHCKAAPDPGYATAGTRYIEEEADTILMDGDGDLPSGIRESIVGEDNAIQHSIITLHL